MLNEKELDSIRRKMLELEEEPPIRGWRTIEPELRPWWRRRILWWSLAGLLLIGAGIGLLTVDQQMPALKQEPIASGKFQEPVAPIVQEEKTKDAPPASPNESEYAAVAEMELSEENPTRKNVPAASADGVPLQSSAEAVANVQLSEKTENAPSGALSEVPKKIQEGKKDDEVSAAKEAVQQQQLQKPEASYPDQNSLIPAEATRLSVAKEKEQNAQAETEGVTANAAELSPQLLQDTPEEQQASSNRANGESATPNEVAWPVLSAIKPVWNQQLQAIRLPLLPVQTEEETRAEEEELPVDKAAPADKYRHWSIGVFAAPRYAYRTMTPNPGDEMLITQIRSSGLTKDRLGFDIGITVGKELSQRLALETSLSLLQLREKVAYAYATDEVKEMTRTVTEAGTIVLTPTYAAGERELQSNYAYASWRLGAAYYFWDKGYRRFSFSAAGGINLLVKGTTEEYKNGEWVASSSFPDENNILEQTNYNLLVGAAYHMQVFQQYELSVMPLVNYFLGSTYKEREPLGMRPYSFGLSLAFKRQLRF